MFTTCLHCHTALGANEVVEHFPVGRRLAFDSAKGRLWVVCDKCRRWNLTPLEERWEAIEECERAFSRTRMRASSENIALARVPEGLDLVRVGAPRLPEFAAWRYGASLHKRWQTRAIPLGTLAVSGYGIQLLMQAQVLGGPTSVGLIAAMTGAAVLTERYRSRVKVMLPGGRVATVRHSSGKDVQLEPDAEHGWSLKVTHEGDSSLARGIAATHGLRGVLTALNFFGARRAQIAEATTLLGTQRDPGRFLARVAEAGKTHGAGNLGLLPPEVRLALEMALHEEAERAALEGELTALADEWHLAEEVARIADEMFLPATVMQQLARLKSGEAS